MKIAIITDCPKQGTTQPLAESYATTFKRFAKAAKIPDEDLYLLTLFEEYPGHVPTGNKGFDWDSFRQTSQVKEVEKQLSELNPDIIIGLSSFTLKYLKDKAKSLEDERGSPFYSHNGLLTICTYHPRDTFTRFELGALVIHDLKKALRLAKDGWRLKEIDIVSLPSYQMILKKLDKWSEEKPLLTCDIETWYKTKIPELDGQITCVGFAESPTSAFVIPFTHTDKYRTAMWQVDEEAEILKKLKVVLEECPLIGHNAVHFDHFMLTDKYGIDANFIHDTMFMAWSLHAEFPKSLAFCSSLYTDNPFWKDELSLARKGIIPRWKEFEYCGRDCCVTYEVFEKMNKLLEEL